MHARVLGVGVTDKESLYRFLRRGAALLVNRSARWRARLLAATGVTGRAALAPSPAVHRREAGSAGSDQAVNKLNHRETLACFSNHWSPKVVGELNGQHVKLVTFQGEFV
jgi:hypothetical protein